MGMSLEEIKQVCLRSALHSLEVANEKLNRTLRSADELQDQYLNATKNDIRTIITYLQDAIEEYGQVSIIKLAQEEQE